MLPKYRRGRDSGHAPRSPKAAARLRESSSGVSRLTVPRSDTVYRRVHDGLGGCGSRLIGGRTMASQWALRMRDGLMDQPELMARLQRRGDVLAGWVVAVGLLVAMAAV